MMHPHPVQLDGTRPVSRIAVQNFVSISGGKDSQAVLCKMVERIERKGLEAFGNRAPSFLFTDTGHETPIAYLDNWLRRRVGPRIEIASANDVPAITHEAAFARIAVGGSRGTYAASLIVEAFGDAVVPQIPEAIGRVIRRAEAALDLVLGARPFSVSDHGDAP